MKDLNFRTWHRRLGVFSVIMVLWLAFSGIIINHSDALALNKKTLNIPFVNSLYGLSDTGHVPQAVLLNDNYFFCYEGEFYQNKNVLSVCSESITSGVYLNEQFVLLNAEGLFVVDLQKGLVDKVPFSLLGKSFSKIFSVNAEVVVFDLVKSEYWQLDLLSLNLKPFNIIDVNTQTLELKALPDNITESLGFPGINVERILLDAHSGRLFGIFGRLVVDFFALAFVALGLSGFWIFLKRSL